MHPHLGHVTGSGSAGRGNSSSQYSASLTSSRPRGIDNGARERYRQPTRRQDLAVMSDQVGRDEFLWLRQRVDSIDATGTRGEMVLATQVKQVIGDIAQLRNDLLGHRGEHARAERARVVGRRWLIGLIIALVAAVDGPVVTLLLAAYHR